MNKPILEGLRIKRITIVTNAGVKSYAVGDRVNGKTITDIVLQALNVGNETVHYYCGFAMEHLQPVVFSIAISSPHEIEYD